MTSEEAEKSYKCYEARMKLAGLDSGIKKTSDGGYALTVFKDTIPDYVTDLELENRYPLKTIDIPSSIRRLGDYTLSNSSLVECIIPETVVQFDSHVFENSFSLLMVEFDMEMRVLPSATFKGCTWLRYVKLPNDIDEIGIDCFSSCSSLKSIDLPSCTKIICDGAFMCSGLQSICLEGVTLIGEQAFSKTINLTEVTIPSSVEMYKSAFLSSHLRSVNISSEVVSPYAFAYSKKLSHVVLNCGVKRILQKAFASCISLREITIPKSVNYIDRCAFAESRLERVFLPKGCNKDLLDAFKNVDVKFYE